MPIRRTLEILLGGLVRKWRRGSASTNVQRGASIYLRRGILYLKASSASDVAGWIEHGTCVSVANTSSAELKGQAALKALSESRESYPHPTDWKEFERRVTKPFLDVVGVRSWSALMSGTQSISLRRDAVQLRFQPLRNMGRREGFEEIGGAEVLISLSATPTQIGNAIDEAFRRCDGAVPRLYADFNNADPDGRVRLTTAGTRADLETLQITLREGMRIVIDDHDELFADAIVSWSESEQIWVAQIDWQAIHRSP